MTTSNTFEVAVSLHLEVTCQLMVKAVDEVEAEAQVQYLLDHGKLCLSSCSVGKTPAWKLLAPAGMNPECVEVDQHSEIYTVDEV